MQLLLKNSEGGVKTSKEKTRNKSRLPEGDNQQICTVYSKKQKIIKKHEQNNITIIMCQYSITM